MTLSEVETPFVVPGQDLVDHCKGVVLEDLGSRRGVLHTDGEDQEDLLAQDTHQAVPELLFDKTFSNYNFTFSMLYLTDALPMTGRLWLG